MIDKNEQLTMDELLFEMKHKYKDFDITRQHLGRVVRANNRTRKRTRHQHFPKERYKKPTNKENEMNDFYKEVSKYPIDKIICLDETSVGSHLKPAYSRCYIGKRCVIKTNNNFVFRSFTLLVAINNKKCVGKIFYEKGGTTQETPMTNSPIENYFNQIKTYIKKKRDVYSFEELAKNVDTSIEKVKPENYKNYFEYAYGTTKKTEYTRKSSTRKHKLKLYKDV